MRENPNNSLTSQADDDVQLYQILEEQPKINHALQICSVPLRLTRDLVNDLVSRFASGVTVEELYQKANQLGLLTRRGKNEWRLDQKARKHFLTVLENQNPQLARQAHTAMLDYLGSPIYPTPDEDHTRLYQAYHTTPLDQDAGAKLYWITYCRIRASNRSPMLPVLTELTESQNRCLTNHEQNSKLYHAVRLYYEGPAESKDQAAALLEEILDQKASAAIMLEASFLLGTLQEQMNQDRAIELYEQSTSLEDVLDLTDQDPDVQRHLRLTLNKSYVSLASILQATGPLQDRARAEEYYRYGIQIVSAVDPEYEATQLRDLVEILHQRGEEKEVEGYAQRIGHIERPFRQEFLEEALGEFQKTWDIGPLYYAISALNHGMGYDSQLLQIEVGQDGAARLTGTYTIKATSMLNRTDTYLETVPESQVGVHFKSMESLTPGFTLAFKSLSADDSEIERLAISIDPPMQPGDQLTYRWVAQSSPGTFATTPQQLQDAGLDYEYTSWDINAPVKELEIQVVIPTVQAEFPLSTWVDVWRIGRWHATTPTAYRASLDDDDPSHVGWGVRGRPGNKSQLEMKVDYPWLAMKYVLAWSWMDKD